jgi:hypothetical protein
LIREKEWSIGDPPPDYEYLESAAVKLRTVIEYLEAVGVEDVIENCATESDVKKVALRPAFHAEARCVGRTAGMPPIAERCHS